MNTHLRIDLKYKKVTPRKIDINRQIDTTCTFNTNQVKIKINVKNFRILRDYLSEKKLKGKAKLTNIFQGYEYRQT